MAKQQVVIDVKPGGEVHIEALGFEGADCEAATREIERALGKVEQREHKREYHHRPLRSKQQQRS